MRLIRFPFLLAPVIFVVVFFLIDKIFLLPEVRDRFIQPGGMLYYGQRREQLTTLQNHLKTSNVNEKVAVVLGDSRAFALGNLMAKLSGTEGWNLYNFAGPQAVPAYYLYLTEKILSHEKTPTHLIISVSPDSFNRNSGLLGSPNLTFGVDANFISKYRSMIPQRDLETYESSRRFALTGMQFSLKTLLHRTMGSLQYKEGELVIPPEFMLLTAGKTISEEQKPLVFLMSDARQERLAHYNLQNSPERKLLDLGQGGQYAWFGAQSDEKLKLETERISSLYLSSYAVSQEELFFYRKTLELARKAGVKVLVFRPMVNPHLRKILEEHPLMVSLWGQIQLIAEQEGADIVDLNHNTSVSCDQYYDATHMSVNCFPSITKYLLNRLDGAPKKAQ